MGPTFHREGFVWKFLLFVCVLTCVLPAAAQKWVPLGPDGGDVRSLTYDPQDPSRIYLGTSAGQLFLSTDNGQSWSRLAHLGDNDDTVLDHIVINPQDGTMFAATWRADENSDGDLYRSTDRGVTWKIVEGMHGKSIRSFAMSQSDPKLLIAGTLDGVYRSVDEGKSWQRISPEHHAEIKNIESVAIDPKDPNVIYAGTWHLPWKTTDGGLTWHSIKQGVIDDSDVFSIIVSHASSSVVYASACSGIYKSESAGELFHKIQGIPATARRTRVLKQDPANPDVVYAGTTEGLWKTIDGGKTFKRISAPNIIVNDVMIDPRQPSHVLVASDRSGVLISNDAGTTFAEANRGFAHRHVASLLVDRNDSSVLYAGVLNDKEFGGVFVSRTAGAQWEQRNTGLGTRDVFVLRQLPSGELLAGTNNGVFVYSASANAWKPSGPIVRETVKTVRIPKSKKTRTVTSVEKSELTSRVFDIEIGETPASKTGAGVADPHVTKTSLHAPAAEMPRIYAATYAGLFVSDDGARSWSAMPIEAGGEIVAVRDAGRILVAMTARKLFASVDHGQHWYESKLPSYVTKLNSVAIDADSVIWLATREGAVRSADGGDTWEHVLAGLPHSRLQSIVYDGEGHRLLATAIGSRDLFESTDGGRSWHREDAGYSLRSVVSVHGRLLANTAFDGVILLSGDGTTVRQTAAASGGAQR